MGYTDVSAVTYGSVGWNILSVNPVKIDSTIKQTLGKRIAKHNIPGRAALDWRLDLSGIIYSTGDGLTIETKRELLETLQDGTKHHYNDGHITGSFAIENDGLTFDDCGEKVFNHYTFKLQIVEWEGE